MGFLLLPYSLAHVPAPRPLCTITLRLIIVCRLALTENEVTITINSASYGKKKHSFVLLSMGNNWKIWQPFQNNNEAITFELTDLCRKCCVVVVFFIFSSKKESRIFNPKALSFLWPAVYLLRLKAQIWRLTSQKNWFPLKIIDWAQIQKLSKAMYNFGHF